MTESICHECVFRVSKSPTEARCKRYPSESIEGMERCVGFRSLDSLERDREGKTCEDCASRHGGLCAVNLSCVEREEDQIDIERLPDPGPTGADGVDVTNSICVNCTHCAPGMSPDGMKDYANAQCRLHRLIASIERLECDDFQHWTVPLQRRTDETEIDAAGVQNRQVGGDHYVRYAIQPWDIWREYSLDPWEASALKYLLRRKGKRLEDLEKCRHYLELPDRAGGRLMSLHSCWTSTPRPHPWHPEIQDVACGYDERLVSPRCTGCHRARPESPRQQLDALGRLGDVAQQQVDVEVEPCHG